MRRIFLKIAYDGTNYHGFQIQPNAETIEGVLNRELSRILKEDITVIGASRTDAGVHALGNVAVFDTNAKIPGEKVAYALNVSLPDDIKIQQSMEVPIDFHPRYQETIKTYEYKIYDINSFMIYFTFFVKFYLQHCITQTLVCQYLFEYLFAYRYKYYRSAYRKSSINKC